MAFSLNTTNLTTTLGAFFRENKNILAEHLYLPLVGEKCASPFFRYAKMISAMTDEVGMPSILINDIVKPATAVDTFTPTANAINFNARILKVRRFKFDLQLQPQELEQTWLSYFKTPGSEHEQKWSLEEFVMRQIIAKAQANIRTGLTVGVYNIAGTTPASIVDGFVEQVNLAILGGEIINATVTAVNKRERLEQVYDTLGEPYKCMPTVAILSATEYDAWIRTNTSTLGREHDYDSKVPMIYGTQCEVVRDASLTGNRVYIFPKEDFLYIGADTMAEYTQVRVQEFDRNIKLLGDGKIGINFSFTNPVAGASPIATGLI